MPKRLFLNPSLFSLEPPAGYTINNLDVKMPVEDDLVNVLRLIAEHNYGTFPDAIGMTNKEFLHAAQAAAKSETEKFLKEQSTEKLLEDLKAQYGNDQDGFRKAMLPFNQRLTQKNMQGMTFYNMLTSANDSHYVGKDVKLDTPDRPIFWYKPTGADKYRVIYADLSVKELTADEVKKLPRSEGQLGSSAWSRIAAAITNAAQRGSLAQLCGPNGLEVPCIVCRKKPTK